MGANKYYIDGVRQATLTLNEGSTYRLDQSDGTNSGHPLRFSTTSDGTHAGGSEYTTGVTTTSTYTQITVASEPRLCIITAPITAGWAAPRTRRRSRQWQLQQQFVRASRRSYLKAYTILQGGGDTFKVALYTSSASLDASTTAYTTSNEVSGTGYSAGGATLTAVAPTTSGTTAFVDFNDVTFSSSTITARGCLIYNSSDSNKAVAVFDFGSDRVQ